MLIGGVNFGIKKWWIFGPPFFSYLHDDNVFSYVQKRF